jgi:hypothetical protein
MLGRWDRKLGLAQLCGLKRGHTFGESLTALIASISNGDFEGAFADWTSRLPAGVRQFFSVSVSIESPRPFPAAFISFETPAFGHLDLSYVRTQDARKLTIDSPRLSDIARGGVFDLTKLSQYAYDLAFDLTVRALVSEQTLASIGLVLRKSEANHG